ncbi:MAG TPA: hypothetical protein EYP22_07690 [Methanosarcinales archaeon]|nr:hypothetical protein [Methanosarcinales archaeon]
MKGKTVEKKLKKFQEEIVQKDLKIQELEKKVFELTSKLRKKSLELELLEEYDSHELRELKEEIEKKEMRIMELENEYYELDPSECDLLDIIDARIDDKLNEYAPLIKKMIVNVVNEVLSDARKQTRLTYFNST